MSCQATQLWFERGSTCKRMCYIARCNSINILTLAQKLLLQTLLGDRRRGRAQKGTVLNKGINKVHSQVLVHFPIFTKLGLTTCILLQTVNSTEGRDRSRREEYVLIDG